MTVATLAARVCVPLDRFTLEVDFESSAPVTGLWGASGSGKTTLLEVLAGLRANASGRVGLDDATWLDSARGVFLPPERRRIGYVPQESLLFPHLTVRGNLEAGAYRSRAERGLSATLIERAVRTTHLEGLVGRDVASLSGGERQRVALARALCSSPSLLLLDEPFASLDLSLRRSLLPLFARIREDFAIPIVLVSHDPTEVQIACDDVIVLREGKMVARGRPRDVIARPGGWSSDDPHGFENLVRGVIEGALEPFARVRAIEGFEGLTIDVPLSARPVGSEVYVGVRSRDILLAKGPLGLLSARNRVEAQVTAVDAMGARRLLRVRPVCARDDLLVEVTTSACEELGLVVGAGVTAIFKSSSCAVYPID